MKCRDGNGERKIGERHILPLRERLDSVISGIFKQCQEMAIINKGKEMMQWLNACERVFDA